MNIGIAMSAVEQKIEPEDISTKSFWKSIGVVVKFFSFSEKEILHLLGGMSRAQYYKGMKNMDAKLSRDQIDRVSYLLGMRSALRILFTDSQQAATWIDRPNQLPPFNGKRPRDYLLDGSLVHLADTRRFLDFWRGR